MPVPKLIPVMEGHGEVEALSLLIRRLLNEWFGKYDIQVGSGAQGTVRAPGRGSLEKDLDKFLRYARRKPDCAGILVLLDADKDCPLELAKRLTNQSVNSGINVPVQIVCAKEEYEAWFLASLETISSQANIPPNRRPEPSVEEQPSPKSWLTHNMPDGRAYKPTSHQVSFTSKIDLHLAHENSRSFRRLCHAIEQLLASVSPQQG